MVASVSKRARPKDDDLTWATQPDQLTQEKALVTLVGCRIKRSLTGMDVRSVFYLNYYFTYARYTLITVLAIFFTLFIEVINTLFLGI